MASYKVCSSIKRCNVQEQQCMVYPYASKKQCIILLCLLLIMEVVDSYLHPNRFMVIPMTLAIVWTILTIVFTPESDSVQHPHTSTKEMNRLVKENGEMCQTIHRMSEEHRLLCEIRTSLAHLRKTANESLYMLHQMSKLVKRARSTAHHSHSTEKEGGSATSYNTEKGGNSTTSPESGSNKSESNIPPIVSTALTKQDSKFTQLPESKVEYIDYEKVRIAFKQANSMLSNASSEFSLSGENCIAKHIDYAALQHTSISTGQNISLPTSDLFSAARKAFLKRSNSFH